MDKRVIQRRMRQKRRQLLIRKITKLVFCAVAAVLLVVFVVKGIIGPITGKLGGKEEGTTQEVQAKTQEADPSAAIRHPIKGEADAGKLSSTSVGWQEDENGKWYQNADGSYYAGGMAEIDGSTYGFDENGYLESGWATYGSQDYYFNDDGTLDPQKQRPMIALTFDDGPGEYTNRLLDCLEEYDAHATFFMLGQNVGNYPDAPKRMLEIGCELGNHSWSHPQLTTLGLDQVSEQFEKTNQALEDACGSPATVARTPYGAQDDSILSAVGLPCFMWSTDSLDWKLLDAQADIDSIMNDETLGDGSIILMHDIHEPSVDAAIELIPMLIDQGYKLVTVSELAEAKGVSLEAGKSYSDFWPSTIESLTGSSSEDDYTEEDYTEEDYTEDEGDGEVYEDYVESTSNEEAEEINSTDDSSGEDYQENPDSEE